jgi:hypothetical protein
MRAMLAGLPERTAGCLLVLATLLATGCQVSMNGQTLPSAYYLTDDLRYDAPGPEMKVMREAAAQRQFAQEQAEINQ